MAGLLTVFPRTTVVNGAGTPYAGGKAYYYQAGTTTLISVYPTAADAEAGTNALSNPVVADSNGRFAAAYIPETVTSYRVRLTTSADVLVWDEDNIPATPTLSQDTVADALFPRSAAETSAGVSDAAVSKEYLYGDARRVGARFDNSTDDTTALTTAIGVADETVSGSQGATVDLPTGTAIVSSQISLPNRVRLRGQNQRGSTIKASAGHGGPYVFRASNGTSSMFDSLLEDMNIDCNDVAGLGGVLSDAWQENSGLRGVLINKFRTYGVRYSNGYGGASMNVMRDCELFASTGGATAGIRVDEISSVGGFMLKVENTTITGATIALPKCIDVVKDSLYCNNVHFETATTGVYLDGVGNHVLIGLTGASDVTNLVEIAATFTGTLTMIGCFRNSSTNFLKDNRSGGLGTIAYDIPLLTIGTADSAINSPGAAKAWCIFDGTASSPITPAAGFNVTNVTKNSTGDYTINLTRAMASLNASIQASCNLATDSTHVRCDASGTGSVRVRVYVAGVLTDANEVKVTVHGN